jgi:protocatechuate 3,4-dioxygenase, beta subunit
MIRLAMLIAAPLVAFALRADSGLAVGDPCPAFEPTHVTGPDAGTATCPVCKYGPTPAVQVWVNTDKLDDVMPIAMELEKVIRAVGIDKERAFVVFTNSSKKPAAEMKDTLSAIAKKAGLEKVALVTVPSASDAKTAKLYKINPDASVENTVLVYANRKVVAKFVNLKGDKAGLAQLVAAMEKSRGLEKAKS